MSDVTTLFFIKSRKSVPTLSLSSSFFQTTFSLYQLLSSPFSLYQLLSSPFSLNFSLHTSSILEFDHTTL